VDIEPTAPTISTSDSVSYSYDNLDRLITVTYASGPTITYTYDAAGNRTSILLTGGETATPTPTPTPTQTPTQTPTPTPTPDPTMASNNAYNWLKSRLLSTGLVDSYQNQDDICYTYDQAVAAIAFLAKGDNTNARKILDAVKSLQGSDGSW